MNLQICSQVVKFFCQTVFSFLTSHILPSFPLGHNPPALAAVTTGLPHGNVFKIKRDTIRLRTH